MNAQFFSPACPTFPVADQFGSIIFSVGLSKLETAALTIGAALTQTNGGKVEPEVIAEEAVLIAAAILERCHEEAVKAAAANKPNLQLVK